MTDPSLLAQVAEEVLDSWRWPDHSCPYFNVLRGRLDKATRLAGDIAYLVTQINDTDLQNDLLWLANDIVLELGDCYAPIENARVINEQLRDLAGDVKHLLREVATLTRKEETNAETI